MLPRFRDQRWFLALTGARRGGTPPPHDRALPIPPFRTPEFTTSPARRSGGFFSSGSRYENTACPGMERKNLKVLQSFTGLRRMHRPDLRRQEIQSVSGFPEYNFHQCLCTISPQRGCSRIRNAHVPANCAASVLKIEYSLIYYDMKRLRKYKFQILCLLGITLFLLFHVCFVLLVFSPKGNVVLSIVFGSVYRKAGETVMTT